MATENFADGVTGGDNVELYTELLMYLDLRLQLLHILNELLSQLFDLLVVADVTQTQLVRVLHLEFVYSRLQLNNHRVLPTTSHNYRGMITSR